MVSEGVEGVEGIGGVGVGGEEDVGEEEKQEKNQPTLQIILNPTPMHTLRQHNQPPLHPPRQHNLTLPQPHFPSNLPHLLHLQRLTYLVVPT